MNLQITGEGVISVCLVSKAREVNAGTQWVRGPNAGEGLRLSPVPQVWKRRVKAAEKERPVKEGETGRVAAQILIGESISKKEWAIVSEDADRTASVTT